MSTSRLGCIIDQKRASAAPTEVMLPPSLKAGVPLLISGRPGSYARAAQPLAACVHYGTGRAQS